MTLLGVPIDGRGYALADRGTELYTTRVEDIPTTGTAISLPVDVKEILIHIEGSTTYGTMLGTAPGSVAAKLTDGHWFPTVPICKNAEETIVTLASDSATIKVSIWAWR